MVQNQNESIDKNKSEDNKAKKEDPEDVLKYILGDEENKKNKKDKKKKKKVKKSDPEQKLIDEGAEKIDNDELKEENKEETKDKDEDVIQPKVKV